MHVIYICSKAFGSIAVIFGSSQLSVQVHRLSFRGVMIRAPATKAFSLQQEEVYVKRTVYICTLRRKKRRLIHTESAVLLLSLLSLTWLCKPDQSNSQCKITRVEILIYIKL